MFTFLCVITAVLAYALFREWMDRKQIEKDLKQAERNRDSAWDKAEDYSRQITIMEKEQAFRDGVEAASGTNALYNRFMRQAVNGQGTVKLVGTRGAPLSRDEWRRGHE